MPHPFSTIFESVSELTARIKQALKEQFAEVALHGEVSNVARPKSGHVYLTLKDESASIRAVIWKSEARLLPFDLTDGLAVRAIGSLTLYEPRGDYQITVRQIEPEGIGGAGTGIPAAALPTGSRRVVRSGSEATAAAFPPTDCDRNQPDRRGDPRSAPGDRPALAYGRDPDRSDSGPGRWGRPRSCCGPGISQPSRRRRFDRGGPRRWQPGGPLDLQRRSRGPGHRGLSRARGYGDRS